MPAHVLGVQGAAAAGAAAAAEECSRRRVRRHYVCPSCKSCDNSGFNLDLLVVPNWHILAFLRRGGLLLRNSLRGIKVSDLIVGE